MLDAGGYFCVRVASSGRVCPRCRHRAVRRHQHGRGEREVVASPARDETLQARVVVSLCPIDLICRLPAWPKSTECRHT